MPSSDDEYEQDISDDELNDIQQSGYGTRSKGPRGRANAGQASKKGWEDIQRSWEGVAEGADGSLAGTVEGLREARKRKRILKDTTALQRGIIRHVILIIDMSSSMAERDMRPSRYIVSLRYVCDFVRNFFEENPISQLGIIGIRDGLAQRISDLSGNPRDHLVPLRAMMQDQEPKGSPSLQNALELARGALYGTPTHGTREIIVIYGAVFTVDPGDIHKTIQSLMADKVRASVIGLSARMAICEELCAKTNGVSKQDHKYYAVALHEQHFRDLLFAQTTPPAILASTKSAEPSLMQMGFPSRIEDSTATPCACHDNMSTTGYLCSRCKTKVCSLPTECPNCRLQLIQSTHLARSYHHLFPLKNFKEVSWDGALAKGSVQCFACLTQFPAMPDAEERAKQKEQRKKQPMARGASESSRYACTTCGEHFCIDCDVFAHEVIHNCAGCLSKPSASLQQSAANMNGDKVNGQREDTMDTK